MDAANNHLPGYPSLTQGAAELIVEFGVDSLKEMYVPKMLSGTWGGTMCLTEPQAGSSLSDITTKATPTEDGFYKISGQKIFISGGDNQFTENIVHLVLARIDGAPKGTKGISLFVVPKNRPKPDGSLEYNDVMTVADFQKMGQRGYCTTHLGFGDSDYMNFPMGPAPDAPEVKLHFMHCDNPRHHTVALYESPIPPSGLIHTMVEVNNVDEVGHGLDRAMQNNVHISSSLGRHSNDMMVSFYMQTPSGFDLEFGYDGWQVDWETFTKQESKIPSFWGHAFSPPES